jgi:hypothetical protein
MTPGFGPGVFAFIMPIDATDLNTVDELYAFVEMAIQQTALVFDADAPFRPWARTVSAECRDVRWVYPTRSCPTRHWDGTAATCPTRTELALSPSLTSCTSSSSSAWTSSWSSLQRSIRRCRR